ncbi:MAG: FtsQ-type POTRA domain-containing protein [Acidobacteriota bacterium]
MSGLVRTRRRWRQAGWRLGGVGALFVLTTTLAAGLQVREIRVTGARRFPAAEVEATLRHALGNPTIATRAETLRGSVRALPWVADARVQISLDGVVSCVVSERTPVAVAADGDRRAWVDAAGVLLGPPDEDGSLVELRGFSARPEERVAALAAVASCERQWGDRLVTVERAGPREVTLQFAGTTAAVVIDPADATTLAAARRVLAAWESEMGSTPLRLDARVAGRVAVLPALTPPKASS